jgi:lysophospholipase L1-like esterase
MADALGQKLRIEFAKHGVKSVVLAKEATYIPDWAGPKMGLASQLAWYKPGLVIIQIGGNEMAVPDPSVRKEAIRRLVKSVGDRPCIWIATPKWEGGPHTGILDVIRDNCAPCRYVDTNTLISDLKRLGDNVHPTIPERRRWARFMVRWLRHNLDPAGARPWDLKVETSAPPAQ